MCGTRLLTATLKNFSWLSSGWNLISRILISVTFYLLFKLIVQSFHRTIKMKLESFDADVIAWKLMSSTDSVTDSLITGLCWTILNAFRPTCNKRMQIAVSPALCFCSTNVLERDGQNANYRFSWMLCELFRAWWNDHNH